jgi:signal transduction histidine kinase
MMAYRMRLLGGECKVTATPNGGTTVLAVVPLARVTA